MAASIDLHYPCFHAARAHTPSESGCYPCYPGYPCYSCLPVLLPSAHLPPATRAPCALHSHATHAAPTISALSVPPAPATRCPPPPSSSGSRALMLPPKVPPLPMLPMYPRFPCTHATTLPAQPCPPRHASLGSVGPVLGKCWRTEHAKILTSTKMIHIYNFSFKNAFSHTLTSHGMPVSLKASFQAAYSIPFLLNKASLAEWMHKSGPSLCSSTSSSRSSSSRSGSRKSSSSGRW